MFVSCSNTEQDTNPVINQFFEFYKTVGADQALDKLFSNNRVMGPDKDELTDLKQKLIEVTKNLGRYEGYEIVYNRHIGQSIAHYAYVVKYEKQPLRFSFTLYKAKNNWEIRNFKFDTDLFEEIEESAKFYYIE